MTWAKFEDRFPWHRKVRGLSDAAFRLHVSAICWSCEHLTDGRIAQPELPLLSDIKRPTTAAKELVTAGLWDENDERTGWELHDFLIFNESRETVLARRERDAERKRLGRSARLSPAGTRTTAPDVQGGIQADSDRTDDGQDEDSTAESRRTDPTRPDPTTPNGVVPRKRATPTPDVFPLTEAMRQWGRDHCPHVSDPVAETQQFLDYHRGKGSSQKDWQATWRTWMRNAEKYAIERGARLPSDDGDEPWWMRRGGASA